MARILLLEDNKDFTDLITRCLSSAGHELIALPDGRKAMDALQQHAPALVITDLVMPHQEGIETIIQMRRQHPNLPILAMSGGSAHSPQYLQLAERLGANRTLEKPFGPTELQSAVGELLASAPNDS
jgi:CheY-like chemotaxis protein